MVSLRSEPNRGLWELLPVNYILQSDIYVISYFILFSPPQGEVSSYSLTLPTTTLRLYVQHTKCIKSLRTAFEACDLTHRRLSSSAGRSNFISLLYFFTCPSRTNLSFITWSMYLKEKKKQTVHSIILKTDSSSKRKREREISRCPYLSMVPNSHLGSLLNGMLISWKFANLVAISVDMAESESWFVRMRVFWENREIQMIQMLPLH